MEAHIIISGDISLPSHKLIRSIGVMVSTSDSEVTPSESSGDIGSIPV